MPTHPPRPRLSKSSPMSWLSLGGRLAATVRLLAAWNMTASRSFCVRNAKPFWRATCAPSACLIGAVSVVALVFGPPALADDLKSVVRTLNAIVNPADAWRPEDQARRHGRRERGALLAKLRGGA